MNHKQFSNTSQARPNNFYISICPNIYRLVQDCANVAEVRPSSPCRRTFFHIYTTVRRNGDRPLFAMFAVSPNFFPYIPLFPKGRQTPVRHVRRVAKLFSIYTTVSETATDPCSPCRQTFFHIQLLFLKQRQTLCHFHI